MKSVQNKVLRFCCRYAVSRGIIFSIISLVISARIRRPPFMLSIPAETPVSPSVPSRNAESSTMTISPAAALSPLHTVLGAVP